MVATTQVQFLLERIMRLIFLKNPCQCSGFFKSGDDFFFLMKIVGAVLPPPA
jgi:hypothetical protein